MSSYEVSRSVEATVSSKKALEFVADFRQWPRWSPWLVQEPDCQLEYNGESGSPGSGYSWDGKMIGAGEITLEEVDDSSLVMSLHFIRPFKSRARVRFLFKGQGESCTVHWVMNSKMPWFLFFMKKMMKAWIGMDFERGLLMLKACLEEGEVHSRCTVEGLRQQPELHYLALPASTTLDNISSAYDEMMPRLEQQLKDKAITPTGSVFGLYEKMNMVTGQTEFKICVPVSGPVDVEAPFCSEHLAACETFVVSHTGRYEFLGNAWALAMASSRHQKVRVKRRPMGIERYVSSLGKVAPEELVTEIILFKK